MQKIEILITTLCEFMIMFILSYLLIYISDYNTAIIVMTNVLVVCLLAYKEHIFELFSLRGDKIKRVWGEKLPTWFIVPYQIAASIILAILIIKAFVYFQYQFILLLALIDSIVKMMTNVSIQEVLKNKTIVKE